MKKLYNLTFSPNMPWLKNTLGVFAFMLILLPNYAKASCQAGFTYTIVNGNIVYFKNTSTNSSGNPLKYFWNFGTDNINYDTLNPKWTYHNNGKYVVTLNVFDTVTNCHSVFSDTLDIKYHPGCYASWTCQALDLYKTIKLRFDVYSYDNFKTYTWDFGDGSTANGPSLNHTYANYGTYNICLRIADSSISCYDTICKQITIAKPADIDSCKAYINYTLDNNANVTFNAIAKCGRWDVASYYWDFGDGDTSTQIKPVHKYKIGGPFRVTLIIRGSGSAIPDTVKRAIDFSYFCYNAGISSLKQNGGLNVQAKLKIFPSTKFELDFGDGTKFNKISSDSVFKHTYTSSGTYFIKLRKTDTLYKCKDSSTYKVKVYVPLWCYAGFRATVYGKDSIAYINADSVYAGRDSSFYYWDFGDGSRDSGVAKTYLAHYYKNKGTYKITLKTTNLNHTCSDTHSVYVHILSVLEPGTINGHVYLDATDLADSAFVYLIQYNSADSTLKAIDTQVVTNDSMGKHNSFLFENLKPGKYFVKAALSKNSQFYQIFFPTYYSNSLKWSSATAIEIKNGANNINYTSLHLNIGTNPGGPGFIGGKISAGANKKEGDPLENIQVMLFNPDMMPVTYTYSDKDGNFEFKNLALGQYEVYTEVIGLKTNSAYVTISESNPKVENVQVKVSSSGISTSVRTKLAEDFLVQPKLYPNPAQNFLYLETDMKKSQAAEIVIYNITGQQVYTENMVLKQGKQVNYISTDKLPVGLYMLQLKNALGTDELQYKFVKSTK